MKRFGPFVQSNNDVRWIDDCIVFSNEMKGYDFVKTEDQLVFETQQTRDEIYQWIDILNTQIQNLNSGFKENILKWIELRKDKLIADHDRYNSLSRKINIKLDRKENDILKRIQLDQKPLVKKIRPTGQQLEDYVLDREKVLDVISVIDNYGRQLEKTPGSFQESHEQDLRNIILVSLNGIFEGKATGETFSNRGKTDIYLNIDKGNILICECKFWGGQNLYAQTIDQLLGYLNWRNNYGVIITFSKNKSLTKVIEETATAIKGHNSFTNIFQVIDEGHFMSRHKLPSDENKSVEIHHLFYNLYVKQF